MTDARRLVSPPEWREVTQHGRTTLRWMQRVAIVRHTPGYYRLMKVNDPPPASYENPPMSADLTFAREWVAPVTTGQNFWEDA